MLANVAGFMKGMGNVTNNTESMAMRMYESGRPADEMLRNEVAEHTRSSGECAYWCLQRTHSHACHGFYIVEDEQLNCVMLYERMEVMAAGDNSSTSTTPSTTSP